MRHFLHRIVGPLALSCRVLAPALRRPLILEARAANLLSSALRWQGEVTLAVELVTAMHRNPRTAIGASISTHLLILLLRLASQTVPLTRFAAPADPNLTAATITKKHPKLVDHRTQAPVSFLDTCSELSDLPGGTSRRPLRCPGRLRDATWAFALSSASLTYAAAL